ncbi:RING/U-box superfamily protein [Arabidopsis thaliana]|nr:RING/U-box superfamily protein [Arabidopsis thaliana]ANM59663.1 RING/U-box superfamily protein [Arabidopsis thaliana]|eukprot:NP_001322006.1 RING/U-box superfamily protein [Arabidopsis thaliana]
MAQKRVEYIETTPSVTLLSHQLIQSRKASMSVFFTFEYMILATTTVSIIVKYAFYVTDMLKEGQWEGKPVYTFYLELVRDLLHLSMYLCFFLMIFMNYGLPLHLIRELYETFRNFKIRVTDYLRYRKITSNMNDRFPDATPEELSSNDATCIICREEMTSAKKLVCGHLFHVHCLRSWLERQNTCPTCRALVVPAENATSTASGNRGPHQESLQQGTGTSSSDGQGSSVSAAASENMSRHEARFQAAASAASIYGRSIVYPSSANTLVWSQGNSLLPQTEVEAQRRFLESQIEVLTNQLRLLEKPTTVDTKGKSVADTA